MELDGTHEAINKLVHRSRLLYRRWRFQEIQLASDEVETTLVEC